jgi:tetratricopeptide (TPR) repeat protein
MRKWNIIPLLMLEVIFVISLNGCSRRNESSAIGGTWVRFDFQGNRFVLTLDPQARSYAIDFKEDGQWDVVGECTFSDGQITFVDTAGAQRCPEMKGVYTYFLDEDLDGHMLHLWLDEDSCSGRAWVMPGDWLAENYEELVEQFSRAIAADSTDQEAYYRRGRMWVAMRENEKAFQDLNRAIELGLERAEAYAGRGFARLWISRDYQGGLADYDRAIELDPSLAKAYVQRGRIKFEQDNKRGACEDWEAAFELGFLAAEKLMRHYCRYILKDRYLKGKYPGRKSEQGKQPQ